jgi:hypothetical protein
VVLGGMKAEVLVTIIRCDVWRKGSIMALALIP